MYSTRNNNCWFRFIVFSFDLCDCLSFVGHSQTITTASTNQGSLPDSRQFLCNQKFCSWATDISSVKLSWCSGGSGGSRPPLSELTPVSDWNSYIHRIIIIISFFNCLIFLMKRTLHFATKLNSRDVQKCNCFWVPSCDLFASSRKAVFPTPMATGVHRLRNKWLSLLFQLVDNFGDNSADNMQLRLVEGDVGKK